MTSAPEGDGPPLTSAPAGTAPPALELDHVSAGYAAYRALFDVTFSVPAGGVTALIGSNGAGKSTVARVVTGLIPCSSGRIRLGGVDVTGWHTFRIARAGCAHVPESRGVFADLSVEENLRLTFRQKLGRQKVPEAMGRAYEAFSILGSRRKQRAGTLSGGEQRILSLAKVLVAPPQLLVADELSLGLAPAVIESIYEGLHRINKAGAALLVVEQQVERVLEIAANAVVLEHGSVAYAGAPEGAIAAAERLLASRTERATERTTERPSAAGAGAEEDSVQATSGRQHDS